MPRDPDGKPHQSKISHCTGRGWFPKYGKLILSIVIRTYNRSFVRAIGIVTSAQPGLIGKICEQ